MSEHPKEFYDEQINEADTHRQQLRRRHRALRDEGIAADRALNAAYEAYMASGVKPTLKDLIKSVSDATAAAKAAEAARGPEPSPSIVDAIAKAGRGSNVNYRGDRAFARSPKPPSQR